jgi:hypothetical protein
MRGAGDVRIETVLDARLIEPTDALVRVTRAAICGSDLWPYKKMEHSETGRRMGHEFIGIVEAVGSEVRTIEQGDLVVAPFVWSDGTCVFCQEGLHTSCLLSSDVWIGDVSYLRCRRTNLSAKPSWARDPQVPESANTANSAGRGSLFREKAQTEASWNAEHPSTRTEASGWAGHAPLPGLTFSPRPSKCRCPSHALP